jgi:hypothetical protein
VELLTVTNLSSKNLVSIPVKHVVGLSHGRFTGHGAISTTTGNTFDTVETYSELVQMYQDLTGTSSES